jgi:hypothetical protein
VRPVLPSNVDDARFATRIEEPGGADDDDDYRLFWAHVVEGLGEFVQHMLEALTQR